MQFPLMPRRAARKATHGTTARSTCSKSWHKRWGHPDGQPLSDIIVGSCVEGRVTNITKGKVFVDFGAACDGALPLCPQECQIKLGDLVKGLQVISVDPHRGQVELAFSPIALDVRLVSGVQLAVVNAGSSWTGAETKIALRQSLPRGRFVTKLVSGMQIFEDSKTTSELGLENGSVLQAIIDTCDYLVEEAGVAEVNGHYKCTGGRTNGAPSYINEAGTLLFRYIFSNGVPYWYFSRQSEDVTKKAGDFYRVKTEMLQPPESPADWGIYNNKTGANECPLGDGIFPIVTRMSEADNVCEANDEDDAEDDSDSL